MNYCLILFCLQINYIFCSTCIWSKWSDNVQCHRQSIYCYKFYSRNCTCNGKIYSPLACPGIHLKKRINPFFQKRCNTPCFNAQNWCPWGKWSSWSGECEKSFRQRFRECCNTMGITQYDYGCFPEKSNISNEHSENRYIKCSNTFWRIAAPVIGIFILFIMGIFVLILRRDRRRYFNNVPNLYRNQTREPVEISRSPTLPTAPMDNVNVRNHSSPHNISLSDPPPSYQSLFPEKP